VNGPLPHSRLSERQVLGYALGELSWVSYLVLHLQEADFYLEENRKLFRALRGLEGAQGCDVVAVVERLKADGTHDELGGAPGLAKLADDMPACEADAQRAVERVKALRRVRRVIAAAREIEGDAPRRAADTEEFLAWAEGLLYEALHDAESTPALTPLHIELRSALSELEAAIERGEGLTGVPTDFEALDRLTGGWQPASLTILAARPRMGKSALAGAFAWRAGRAGYEVLFASLEMSRAELVRRMLAAKAKVDTRAIQTATIDLQEMERLYAAATRLSEARVWLCEEPRMTLEQLASLCRLHRARKGLGLVLVDYLQLLRTARKHATREREVADISAGLKALAKELGVPVIALSQLNRGLEARQDKRPMLSDLRDSGAIEQDADTVIFLHREEVYHPDTRDRGVAEVHVAKQRNGPTGQARLAWVAEYTRFEDVREREQKDLPLG